MRRTISAVAGIALAASVTTVMTPVAQAHDGGSSAVARHEFRQVKKGMTRARVHRIFDTTGVVIIPAGGNHPRESREYPAWSAKNGWLKRDGQFMCYGVDFVRKNGAVRVYSKGGPYGCVLPTEYYAS